MADCVDVPGYSDYCVYEDGRVYSKKRKIYLTPQHIPGGYKDVVFRFPMNEEGKTRKHFPIHRKKKNSRV